MQSLVILLGQVSTSKGGTILGATGIRSVYILDCPGNNRPQADCVALESAWMKYTNANKNKPGE